MAFLMECPKDVLPYIQPDDEIRELSKFDLMPPEVLDYVKKLVPMAFDAVRVFESQPKFPYKFPYSYDSPNTIQCNSIPKLPDGVTLPMIKTQYNKVAKKLGIAIPFPEVEYNYTMIYIILLLIVVVVVASTYSMAPSSTQVKSKEGLYGGSDPSDESPYMDGY